MLTDLLGMLSVTLCQNRSLHLTGKKYIILTRMHSSRVCTGHSLTMCWSLLPGGGGVCSWGVSAPGGVSAPRGVSAPGGVYPRMH